MKSLRKRVGGQIGVGQGCEKGILEHERSMFGDNIKSSGRLGNPFTCNTHLSMLSFLFYETHKSTYRMHKFGHVIIFYGSAFSFPPSVQIQHAQLKIAES